MKNKPLIGIVARPNTASNKKTVLGVYQNYIKKVIQNGGIPFIIVSPQDIDYELDLKKDLTPHQKKDLETILKNCDGIIMPGGEDGYQYDYYITDYAIKNNVPLLGICLGMQLMSEYFGGHLEEVSNHYLTNHEVDLKEDTRLKDLYQNHTILVNSRHKFQVIDVKEKYISAISKDHVIEGVEDRTKLFCVGVEWHPEDLESTILFEEFIKSSSSFKMLKTNS